MYQPFDLPGRGIVVTGGNGGIALGMARALLQAGASVAIWGSNRAKTEAAREQLAQDGGDAKRVHAFTCDVGDEAQVESAFAASVSALGRIEACFANAGVSSKGTLLTEMALDEFRRVGCQRRLRRHRCVPGERRVGLRHRGAVRDRRRLHQVLSLQRCRRGAAIRRRATSAWPRRCACWRAVTPSRSGLSTSLPRWISN